MKSALRLMCFFFLITTQFSCSTGDKEVVTPTITIDIKLDIPTMLSRFDLIDRDDLIPSEFVLAYGDEFANADGVVWVDGNNREGVVWVDGIFYDSVIWVDGNFYVIEPSPSPEDSFSYYKIPDFKLAVLSHDGFELVGASVVWVDNQFQFSAELSEGDYAFGIVAQKELDVLQYLNIKNLDTGALESFTLISYLTAAHINKSVTALITSMGNSSRPIGSVTVEDTNGNAIILDTPLEAFEDGDLFGIPDELDELFSLNEIDETAPLTTITSSPDNPSNEQEATFTFEANQPATFECKLDDEEFEECTSPKTYSDLSEGTHTFYVKATDLANNEEEAPVSYEWDIILVHEFSISLSNEYNLVGFQMKDSFDSASDVCDSISPIAGAIVYQGYFADEYDCATCPDSGTCTDFLFVAGEAHFIYVESSTTLTLTGEEHVIDDDIANFNWTVGDNFIGGIAKGDVGNWLDELTVLGITVDSVSWWDAGASWWESICADFVCESTSIYPLKGYDVHVTEIEY